MRNIIAATMALAAGVAFNKRGGTRHGIEGIKAYPSLRAELNARKLGPQHIQDKIMVKAAEKRKRKQERNKALGFTAFSNFGINGIPISPR